MRASNVVERVQGIGLGLASVQQVVVQHGGTVTVASQEGVGSIFTVELPLQGSEKLTGREDA